MNFGRSDGGGYDFMDAGIPLAGRNGMQAFDDYHNWNHLSGVNSNALGNGPIPMADGYTRSNYYIPEFRPAGFRWYTPPPAPPVNLNYDAHPEQRQSRWKYAALVAGATATATGAYLWQRRPTEKQSKSATLAEPDSKKAQSIKSEL